MGRVTPTLTRRLTAVTLSAVCATSLVSCSKSNDDSSSAGSSSATGSASSSSAPSKTSAAKDATLPGGGRTVFPSDGRMYVALYGTPGTPGLGVLGHQNLSRSVKRVKDMAAQYHRLTGKKVVPTFEIIATVASGTPGPKGTYSGVWPPSKYLPWVKEARKQGVYVVLDIQPGTASMLEQSKLYTSLLKYPNVGLALDPEWKLQPGQRPLQQIGHADVSEVNQVSSWLAKFVQQNQLPQKMFLLHQFQLQMIRHRDKLVTGHPQLATVIHADGQGGQGEKQDTWKVLRRGAPKNIHWGWKNFYTMDHPMLTPAQTVARVKPLPSLISYQ